MKPGLIQRETKSPAGSDAFRSIAVLPFSNKSPDPDQEYFCEGIAEEIINALGQIEGLRVTSHTRVRVEHPMTVLRGLSTATSIRVLEISSHEAVVGFERVVGSVGMSRGIAKNSLQTGAFRAYSLWIRK